MTSPSVASIASAASSIRMTPGATVVAPTAQSAMTDLKAAIPEAPDVEMTNAPHSKRKLHLGTGTGTESPSSTGYNQQAGSSPSPARKKSRPTTSPVKLEVGGGGQRPAGQNTPTGSTGNGNGTSGSGHSITGTGTGTGTAAVPKTLPQFGAMTRHRTPPVLEPNSDDRAPPTAATNITEFTGTGAETATRVLPVAPEPFASPPPPVRPDPPPQAAPLPVEGEAKPRRTDRRHKLYTGLLERTASDPTVAFKTFAPWTDGSNESATDLTVGPFPFDQPFMECENSYVRYTAVDSTAAQVSSRYKLNCDFDDKSKLVNDHFLYDTNELFVVHVNNQFVTFAPTDSTKRDAFIAAHRPKWAGSVKLYHMLFPGYKIIAIETYRRATTRIEQRGCGRCRCPVWWWSNLCVGNFNKCGWCCKCCRGCCSCCSCSNGSRQVRVRVFTR